MQIEKKVLLLLLLTLGIKSVLNYGRLYLSYTQISKINQDIIPSKSCSGGTPCNYFIFFALTFITIFTPSSFILIFCNFYPSVIEIGIKPILKFYSRSEERRVGKE